MYTFSIVVIVSIYSSPAVQKELETLRQELLILELLSEVYSNEEHHEHIKLKRSQIELLEDALRKLRVDFPALDGELKNLRQELNVLELFSEVHSGKDQHKRIDGKRSQIGQLEEVLEELTLRRWVAEEMLKNAEQPPAISAAARKFQTNFTSGIVYKLCKIIVWVAALLALVHSHWQHSQTR